MKKMFVCFLYMTDVDTLIDLDMGLLMKSMCTYRPQSLLEPHKMATFSEKTRLESHNQCNFMSNH